MHARFGLSIRKAPLFADAPRRAPSEWLEQTLRRSRRHELISEKARSELLIAPVLLEAAEFYPERLALYSGFSFSAAPQQELYGQCDFALAASPETLLPEAAFLLLAEAKHENLMNGLPQVAAQMRAASLYNAGLERPARAVFGCVTTGELWQFLRYGEPVVTLDPRRYLANELPEILGVLQCIVEEALGTGEQSV